MKHEILALDRAGSPSRWLKVKAAAEYYAADMILGDCGEHTFELRGGISRASGQRSILRVNSIVMIRGERVAQKEYHREPVLERVVLFERDRYVCAYCGEHYRYDDLSMDHIYPQARGGRWSWMNLVTACKPCNARKDDRTPEEARMPLLYAPYIPSRYEMFILNARNILADQMSLLLARVPKHSRLHA